jgi:hypothetical protein
MGRLLIVTVAFVLAAVVGVTAGYADAGSRTAVILAVALLLVVIVWLLVVGRLVLPAVIVGLTAGGANALPGPSLNGVNGPGPGKYAYIIAVLAFVLLWAGRHNLRRVPVWLWISCGALLIWTVGNVLRAWATGAPAGATIKSAADFGVFPVLLPGFVAACQDPRLRRHLVVGFALLTSWVVVTNVAAAVGVIPSLGGFLAHGYRATPTGGLLRIYALSQEVPVAALPFALGAALLARSRRGRFVALLLLLGCTIEVLLGFTRAQYVGVVAMSVVMLAVWGRQYLSRVMVGLAVVAVLGVGATQWGPLVQPLDQVSVRVGSIFNSSSAANLAPGGNTLTYRNNVEKAIRASMSTSDWIVGHGFLPSPWYRFAPDPGGSLRDSDLGWYNALNTMGLIGVVLVVLPVVLVLVACWRARGGKAATDWLIFGGMGYAIYVLVVSETLVTLFSPNGLACAGAALGVGLAAALTTTDERAPQEWRTPGTVIAAPRTW